MTTSSSQNQRPIHILALGGYNLGADFIRQAHARGAKIWVLTKAKHLAKAWPREVIEDVFAEPNDSTLQHTIHTVSYLARNIRFDRIIPFDDVEVDIAARLREHLRVPGMGDTRARIFRDKLAMRVRAEEEGVAVPAYVHVLNYDDIHEFCQRVPPPWMLKPRTEASSTGIQKIHSERELWSTIEQLGDRQSYFLLEQYLPGDVHHVDSIVSEGKIVFAEAHRNGTPPFDVAHHGGIFTTFTMLRGSPEEQELLALNEKILTRFGYLRGVSHVEYIRGKDGKFYFLEAGARVGGAHVADVVEAATGVNLWAEWANIEIDKGTVPYQLPPTRSEYAGLIQTLAKQEHPDTSMYNDPEIIYRGQDSYHAAMIVRAGSYDRVTDLLTSYYPRFMHDYHASLPHYELPPLRAH